MSRKFNNIISVMSSLLRMIIIKIFHFNSFSFNGIQRFSPNVSIELDNGAKFKLGKKVRAHSGVKIKIRSKGKLVIGDNVSFNYNCMVFCHDSITIEEGVEFGPGVLVYDHDHDYKTLGGIKAGQFTTEEIFIGKNAWIGANSIILKGTNIGHNCVIAAGSIVKGNISENSILIQKKNTQIIDI